MISAEKMRIVITGIGVVAPNGIGKDIFWKSCFDGTTGIRPITLFDTSRYRCRYAGEIQDFKPADYLGSKGLRNLDRTTLLALVAAKLAIDDAALDLEHDQHDLGVVLGSSGSIHSVSEFDKDGLRGGYHDVNPSHFPNTVINSPASHVGIRFGLKGLNTTISTGFTASFDALGYAMHMLTLQRAQALLVGGVEELCIEIFLGFYKNGLLATTSDGAQPFYQPHHKDHSGALLGEGAALFVLETLSHAQKRGANIYAEVIGYGSSFNPDAMYKYDSTAKGTVRSIQEALSDADIPVNRIEHISSSANSCKACDEMEDSAFQQVFGSALENISVTRIKQFLGESLSAGGALQFASSIGIMSKPMTLSRSAEHHDPTLMKIEQPEYTPMRGCLSLINGSGITGHSSALVIRILHE